MSTVQELSEADLLRFRSKIRRVGSHDMWEGTVTEAGYGKFRTQGKNVRAHRLAWFLKHGEWPGEMTIDHWCKRKLCVNPDHLRLATMVEQMGNRRADTWSRKPSLTPRRYYRSDKSKKAARLYSQAYRAALREGRTLEEARLAGRTARASA